MVVPDVMKFLMGVSDISRSQELEVTVTLTFDCQNVITSSLSPTEQTSYSHWLLSAWRLKKH